jgi:hypothetical protein
MTMEIKMPVKFHANYVVTIRTKDWEAKERAQKLTVRELTNDERKRSFKGMAEKDMPTHQFTFYDFGCKRILEGSLVKNEEDRVSFHVNEKEYEFHFFVPKKDA